MSLGFLLGADLTFGGAKTQFLLLLGGDVVDDVHLQQLLSGLLVSGSWGLDFVPQLPFRHLDLLVVEDGRHEMVH